jgi:integrase
MSLCKRNNIWWIRFTHQGQRIQESSGTSDKVAAQQLHDQLKAELWKRSKLKEIPRKDWNDAVIRWAHEAQHKKSLYSDKAKFRWLSTYLKGVPLAEITRDKIEDVISHKEKKGVSPATVNRILALIRAILRKAEREWGWLERAPAVRMRKEPNRRIRWLTQEQAQTLIKALPSHLADVAAFALLTGLRHANVVGLQWQDVDLEKEHALIHPDQAKAEKAIPVPLSTSAVEVLRRQIGKHPVCVFTYKGKPLHNCNTQAWRSTLKKVGVTDFRWHDLRHTWASWHVQNGTNLQELQQLGGWASYSMVLRYAHLSSDHLKKAAERIPGTILVQPCAASASAPQLSC